MDPQLKKGLLELVVLASLTKEDSYGYKIIQDVSPIIEISESTLYPILRRLEQQDFVSTYNVIHLSRVRKYYKITTRGQKELVGAKDDLDELKKIYAFIIKEAVWKNMSFLLN